MTTDNQIKIYGKTYHIKSSSPTNTPQELASMVDSKMHELASSSVKASTVDLAVLTALNIAQELLETKHALEQLTQDTQNQTEQLEKRCHDLVQSLQAELPS